MENHDLAAAESTKKSRLPAISLIFFYTLSFLLNWALIVIYQYIPFAPLQILMAWSPNIAAIIVVTFVLKEKNGVRNLFKGWKKWKLRPFWYLVGFSPVIMTLIIIFIIYFILRESPNPATQINWGYILFMLIIAIFTGATGEELGWRGFLQPQLQTQYNWLTSSIIVGFCWGFWHLPLWIMGIWDSNVVLYVITSISFSVIIGWAFNKTNQSVFIASMFHYFVNVSVLLISSTGLELISTDIYTVLELVIFSLYAVVVAIHYRIKEKHLVLKESNSILEFKKKDLI